MPAEPTATPPAWATEDHPTATGWVAAGDRRWRAALPCLDGTVDLLLVIDAAGEHCAHFALVLAEHGAAAEDVADIVYRQMEAELADAAAPHCAKPDCGRKSSMLFTAAEAGPLAGVQRVPGEEIRFCPTHGHDVYVAAAGAAIAPWLKPDAVYLDPMGAIEAAAYAGDRERYDAALARLRRLTPMTRTET